MKKPVLLVAEDNALDAMLLQRVIERCGDPFVMAHAEHGEAAIEYLQGAGRYADRAQFPAPDILLLDLKMPRKDGFAVLRWRRENPTFARLPIIVFSSSNLAADITLAYSLGANSYIVKATSGERLERMIRALHEWWAVFNVTAA